MAYWEGAAVGYTVAPAPPPPISEVAQPAEGACAAHHAGGELPAEDRTLHGAEELLPRVVPYAGGGGERSVCNRRSAANSGDEYGDGGVANEFRTTAHTHHQA